MPHAAKLDAGRLAVALVATALLTLSAGISHAAPDSPYARAQNSVRAQDPPLETSAVEAPGLVPAAPGESPELDGLLPGRVDEIFIELVPARSDVDIATDLKHAREKQAEAERVLAESRSNEARAKAQIDVQKSTIDHLKSQAKLAKEEKRDADRLELERARDTEELVLQVFQRQRDLRGSEKDYAEALRAHAKQAIETHRVEIRLHEVRAERNALENVGVADLSRLVGIERQIRALESDALEVMKDLADKEAKVARARRSIMDRRMKVFQAQRAVRTAKIG